MKKGIYVFENKIISVYQYRYLYLSGGNVYFSDTLKCYLDLSNLRCNLTINPKDSELKNCFAHFKYIGEMNSEKFGDYLLMKELMK